MVDDGSEPPTADRSERVREELERATEGADRDVREQLRSIEEGLDEILGGDKTRDAPSHPDRLAGLEEKLAGLGDETDGDVHRHVATAEALVAGYRGELAEE
ncbi:DUF7553 family protein [Halorarum salinum]|uniref:Uncharacterized protein n=1 Tax=Halorarum salinum TaxID=2743089 RepID=A0A7D5LDI8_9EURY|nr:hypothetical protein [Halobaculum salinum]QLG64212.1 hypothetical protein HUG12_20710 [Halobaculum salinum]